VTRIAKLAVVVAAAVAAGLALTAALPLPGTRPPAGGEGYTVPAAAPSFTSANQRKAVADFSFADGAGAPRSISAYRGKVVLVNFWATWCGPCIKEMPALASLQTKMAGLPFEVLALSQDRGGAAVVKSFYDQQKITNLKVYLDQGGRAGSSLGLRGLPTSVLVDASGREVMRLEGTANWDDTAIVTAIKQVIEGL